MSARLLRVIDGINRLTEVMCVALLVVLVAAAALQVLYRYVLLQPLIWSEEAARYLLVWLSFAAAGLVLRDSGNPRVEVLVYMLSPRTRTLLDFVLRFVVAAFLFVFIWVSWSVALHYLPFRSLGTGVSQSVPRLALPIGGLLMLVNLIPIALKDWQQFKSVTESGEKST